MLNPRYILRLTGAFFSRFKALILICVGLGIAFFFLLKFLLPTLTEFQTSRIGLTGRYTLSNLPTLILNMVSDGLTKLDANGIVEPSLAASWETPDKGKTWIFTLKDNKYWQDGKKVTSSGINYQFSDLTIERPDEKTITFKLQNPYSAFPSVVSRPTFKSGLLGTGTYRVTGVSVNGSVVEELNMKNASGENLVYKFYPTEDQTKTAFELGQVDQIASILDPTPLNSWKKVKIRENSNTGEYVGVFFNTQDNLLKDKNIRQALSYAIDKEALGGQRAISPISIDSWAYNPQVKPYDYDPVKAKEMINDFKTNAKVTDISINLSTTPVLLSKAELISKSWQEAGVNVNLQVISQVPSDFQAFLAIYDIPDDPDQYSMWHSTQTVTNITHYQNPRIDKLLEDGRSEINIDARKKIYLDFQRFLVEDSPAAFLYYPTNFTISRK
ncbi:ABC transporter substrate-binding protein [Patescibacteria group bacterium]|nr:ABC transporter substrate-binding protein [Patescibacteria group bacterium]